MAQGETNIANTIMIDGAKWGSTLFRNVRGQFYTMDCVRALIAACRTKNIARIADAIKKMRQIAAGLMAPGSSDLIGGTRVKITPEMVGQTILVFTAIEVKKEGGYPSPAQKDFVDFVIENGGYAGVARSPEDARRICKIKVDTPQNLQ